MKLFVPTCFSSIGERHLNQDAVFPAVGEAANDSRLFMVCDGVGGQPCGEKASAIACSAFATHFTESDNPDFSSSVSYVEACLAAFQKENPACADLSTTLTVLYLDDAQNKAILGWAGDSRIYHIRDTTITFQSRDHSQIQQLIDLGEITLEESKTYPKNVITRAINGNEKTEIEVHTIDDIQPDDFFLLVSDGILEHAAPSENLTWFEKSATPELVKRQMMSKAEGRTRDNYSSYIIKILSS